MDSLEKLWTGINIEEASTIMGNGSTSSAFHAYATRITAEGGCAT